jgi:hypothetical protein
MMTRFKTLFSLEVRHDYYGGACEDVGFVVPQDVAWLMRGAGLVARRINGALHVFYSATGSGAGAPVRSADGETVRLGLRVLNPSFANVTAGFAPGAGALYYRNGAAAGALDAPVRVTLVDQAPAGDTHEGMTAYVDPELWREGVFGVVEVAIAPAFYESAPSFTVAFQARLEPLRYYVVTRDFSTKDVDKLSVQDQGFGEPGHPDEVKFEKVPPEQLTADEKARTELLGRDGARVLLFRSLSAVTRQRSGRKRIQLMCNSEPLIENLPQPGRDRGTAELVVQLSKSKT